MIFYLLAILISFFICFFKASIFLNLVSPLINFVKLTIVGVYEIITGTRGADELGGPIRIAELSGDFWQKGIESTLWFMMIISLNLGLINLFPIPMLDGGHLLLNLVEFVNGKPLSQKYLELAYKFVLTTLLGLLKL